MKKVHATLLNTAQAAIYLIAILWVSITASVSHAQVPEPSLPYTVKASDKLIVLAKDLLVRPDAWAEVARFNGLKDPNFVVPGQRLDIPLRLLKYQSTPGKVVSTAGDVQLNAAATTVGAVVNEGARLQVGANSSAVIELGDGSRVKLLPATLMEVTQNRSYAMRDASTSGSTTWFSGLLRLAQGALDTVASQTAKRATPLQIETPTSLVGVRGTQFRVAYEDPASRNSRTEVIEGQVRTENPAQKSGADLPRGTGAVVNPAQKEVKVVQLLPAPDLSSLPAEVFKPQAALPMPTLADASGYRVQVASDAQFEKIVRDLKVMLTAGTPTSVDLGSLASASWHTRVRGIDAQGLEGFDAVKLVAVRDAKPTIWRVITSSLSVRNYQTILSWTGVQADGAPLSASRYTVELGSNAALMQPVVQPPAQTGTASNELSLGPLKSGVYFVRLKASAPDGTSLPSEIYRFELTGNWGVSVFDASGSLEAVK